MRACSATLFRLYDLRPRVTARVSMRCNLFTTSLQPCFRAPVPKLFPECRTPDGRLFEAGPAGRATGSQA